MSVNVCESHAGLWGSIYTGFVCCEDSGLIKSVKDGRFSGVFFSEAVPTTGVAVTF